MKQFYSILLIALLVSSLNTFAGDRTVIVERYTSSTCGPCASNNPTMDAFLTSQDVEKIQGISYLSNVADNEARRNYYGVNSIPQAFMDGSTPIAPPYNSGTLTSYMNTRLGILSPITLIVTETITDSLKVKVIVFCEQPMSNPIVTLHIAAVEKYKQFPSPPGTNGETTFRDIMRKLLTGTNGMPLTLYPGTTYVIEKSVYIDPSWQSNQMHALVYVQASDKEVLNAGTNISNFSLLPNPAYYSVQQGQSQNGTYKIKVPVIAPGFNSPVSLTAAVEPVTSGINVTFPSGSTISNFPDSVTMQVTSTNSVPTGAYKIVVTGTSGTGKVHKTTVSYLVGKNYISTNSNRPTLQYKIDNVVYNSPQFFTWDLNSQHTISAVSPQAFGNSRYVFQSWNIGGDTNQTVTLTPSLTNITANYKLQYKLVTSIVPAGIPATVTGGNQFYDSASTTTFSITPLQVQYNNKTYYFQNWQGFGVGSYTGNNPSPQVTMSNILIENAVWDTIAPIGVINNQQEIPVVYSLNQNYPNPFNPSTNIKYGLPHDGQVSLTVYDVLGNEIAVLVNGYKRAGYYEESFNASNLASGIYFYKITSGDFTDIKKMILIK
jgi:hypothetical protein